MWQWLSSDQSFVLFLKSQYFWITVGVAVFLAFMAGIVVDSKTTKEEIIAVYLHAESYIPAKIVYPLVVAFFMTLTAGVIIGTHP